MTTTTLLPVPRPSRLRPWVRGVLWAVALVGTLVAASVLYLVASLSGGLDDLLDLHTPQEGDREVVQAQERALDGMRADVAALPVVPAATAVGQECQVGMHDWKVDDDFDLACTALRAVATEGSTAGFRAETLALHDRLVQDGWTPDGVDLRAVVTDYWDARAAYPRAGFPQGYGPAELPGARYARGDQVLQVAWAADGRSGVDDALRWDPAVPRPAAGRYTAVLLLAQESFRA